MRMVTRFAAAMLALVVGAPAFASPWTGADPARRPTTSGRPDLDFAVTEICFPYIVTRVPLEEVVGRPGVSRKAGGVWRDGLKQFTLGTPQVFVTLSEISSAGRSCTIDVAEMDADTFRDTTATLLARLSLTLKPARQQLPPDRSYLSREVLCSAPSEINVMVGINVANKPWQDLSTLNLVWAQRDLFNPCNEPLEAKR